MEVDWEKIAEIIKSQPNVKNDAGLAKILGISPSMIVDWRQGKRELTLRARVRMLDIGGYIKVRDTLLSFFSEDQRKKIEKKNQEVEDAWVDMNNAKSLPWPKDSEIFKATKSKNKK